MKKYHLLAIAAGVAVVGMALVPAFASAQSVSATGYGSASGSANVAALEAQIASLLSQLASLRSQLGAALGSSTIGISVPPFMPAPSSSMPWNPSSTWPFTPGGPIMPASDTVMNCPVFSRNLSMGASGSDVTQLQGVLSQDGDLPQGDVTGFFGPITAHALVNFQAQNGIAASSSATGFFGPLTRNFLRFRCPGQPLPIIPPGHPPMQPTSTPPSGMPPVPPMPPATPVTGASVTPTSGPVGTSVTISGVASNSLGTTETVLMGGLVAANNVTVASDGSITFTVPSSLSPNCGFGPMIACPMFMMLTSPRTYGVSIISPSSTNALLVGDFTVTGSVGIVPGPSTQ